MATLAVTRRLTCLTPSGSGWSRCFLWARGRADRRDGRNGSLSTGSVGGCGWVRRGGMCRSVTALGGRCMGCSVAGSGPGCGSGSLPPAGTGRCGGVDRLGGSVDSTVARAHQHAAGSRTRPDEQKESPGGVGDGAGGEPADHALGRSRGGLTTKIHLACEQGQKVMSLLVTAGQRGDSPQFQAVLEAISVPRLGAGRLARDRTGSGSTRPTAPTPTAPTCADAASGARSRPRPTRSVTAGTGAPGAAGRRSSARSTTGGVTPSSAASTGSNATAPSLRDSTSSPSATKPPSTSPPSTTGC